MDYKEFFYTNNKSGWKCVEKKLMLNFPGLCIEILNYANTDALRDQPFKVKVYHFLHKLPEIPKCPECGKQLKFWRSIQEGYSVHCSVKCGSNSEMRKINIERTNLERFGVTCSLANTEVRAKAKATNLIKFNCENPFGNSDIKKKIAETNLKKYGFTSATKNEIVKKKIQDTNIANIGLPTHLMLEHSKTNAYKLVKNNFIERYNFLQIKDLKNGIVSIICDVCGEEYNINTSVLNHRVNLSLNPCTLCNKVSSSSISEGNLKEFILSLGVNIDTNNRTLMGNKQELDILISDKNIAIEYDGLFWHSDYKVEDNYHITKTELCENNNIRLIHIFEDEWIFKSDIVKSRLKNILGFIDNRIYGRKCIIKNVDSFESNLFLENNHIQGKVNSKIRIGLYYNDELVSLMTFGNRRNVLGSKHVDNHYELLRFCNKLDTNVVGGASKLFKYFINDYSPENIISYADRRWSVGDLYDKLGFNFKHNSRIGYYYIIKNGRIYSREHRYKYRKDILVKEGFDPNKTEREIMRERKIYRIYDCGNKVYEWVNN